MISASKRISGRDPSVGQHDCLPLLTEPHQQSILVILSPHLTLSCHDRNIPLAFCTRRLTVV